MILEECSSWIPLTIWVTGIAPLRVGENVTKSDPHTFNLLQSICHVMHQQFNIQQLYALPTLYLCVLYLSENKQRLVPLRA
jgi:hypothetical protein